MKIIPMWEKIANDKRLRSGLLLKNIPIITSYQKDLRKPFSSIQFGIIITQPCDLSSYYKAFDGMRQLKEDDVVFSEFTKDAIITHIILCPAFDKDMFMQGLHLKNTFQYIIPSVSAKLIDRYEKKEHFRYHSIKSKIEFIPNFIIDFKHYFTIPISTAESLLEKENEMISLRHIFFTDLSDRFANYLQRVAIPD